MSIGHEPSSLAVSLRAELGLDRIEALLGDLVQRLDALPEHRRFHTISEVAAILRKRPAEVRKLLDDGRLWKVEGLDSSRTLIPDAALEALAQRPTRTGLRSVEGGAA